MNHQVAIIGSGFSGLAASAVLSQSGFKVDVFEKNAIPGGRARNFSANGFTFDMGPTWYWLPDVFEKFFNRFGHSASDLYHLHRVDPSYRMFFGKQDYIDVPANILELFEVFEQLERGSSTKLKKFLSDAEAKYKLGIGKIVYKPSLSPFEYLDWEVISGVLKYDFFKSMSSYIRGLFKNPRIIKILEFPVIFLGASPSETPALYSMMNYADLMLGTWYPMGGMYKVVDAFMNINKQLGTTFHFDTPVEALSINKKQINAAHSGNKTFKVDVLLGSGDYHFIEQSLVPKLYRTYSEKYWQNCKMAPSALLFYLGIDRKLENLQHHNLFFDEDFEKHAYEIYDDPKWPGNPALYVSVSSKTDNTVAPEGCENLIVLIPVATGLTDTEEIRDHYYQLVMDRLENITGESIRGHVIFKRSYAHRDFENDYHSFKGNAYGLANTLLQTAFFKPRMISKKLSNLFYTGQLTVPGPGVPPSIISGQIAARLIQKQFKNSGL